MSDRRISISDISYASNSSVNCYSPFWQQTQTTGPHWPIQMRKVSNGWVVLIDGIEHVFTNIADALVLIAQKKEK